MAILFGVVGIVVGIAWGVLAYFVGRLAAEGVQGWSSIGTPWLGLIPAATGLAIMLKWS